MHINKIDLSGAPSLDTLFCTAMTRKSLALAALLLFAFPAFTQTPTTLPATSSADASTPLKIGGDVLPPKLIFSVKPKTFPFKPFHKHGTTIVLVGLTVPTDGIPQDVHIVKSGGDSFDKSALTAVNQYRFQPATLRGKPVPTRVNIEVLFKVF
jgi:TonB family protein